MPFLFPALLSGVSDVLILVLQVHREEALLQFEDQHDSSGSSSNHNNDESSLASLTVHRAKYLAIVAVMRLLLLLFPLPYHSYTGTAIRYPFCYHLFYALSIVAILLHMVSLSLIDPDSLSTLLKLQETEEESESSLQNMINRSCWWILFLSLISVLCHIVMLIHVRSTAPSMSYVAFPNKKKKLVYYYNQFVASQQTQTQIQTAKYTNLPCDDIEQQQHHDPLAFQTPPPPSRNNNNNNTSPMLKFTTQYDEFITEMQTQISHLKTDWSHKLEDFTRRHVNLIHGLPSNSHQLQHHSNPLLPLTPFRVLLQLFAYEDVMDSGKLQAVFDLDEGQSITFFVPQLLSFLLHGAYYEADPTKLEAWILDKCTSHVHFAHRCYWFLRAWSLEQRQIVTFHTPAPSMTALQPLGNNQSFSLRNALTDESEQQRKHSRNNSFSSIGASSPALANHAGQKLLPEERAVVEDLMLRVVQCGETAARILHYGRPMASANGEGDQPRKKRTRRGKRDKTTTATANQHQQQQRTPTKKKSSPNSPALPPGTPGSMASNDGLFWDEEDDTDQDNWEEFHPEAPFTPSLLVPELVMTPEMQATLPVDPNSGFPSFRHMEALTANHRYGFLPLATAKKEREHLDSTETVANNTTDSFHATPRFLDALLGIADGLFLVPRELRKKELQRQLDIVELEMLPSNAVYGKSYFYDTIASSAPRVYLAFLMLNSSHQQHHSADLERVPSSVESRLRRKYCPEHKGTSSLHHSFGGCRLRTRQTS
jgi:hypothetical protein